MDPPVLILRLGQLGDKDLIAVRLPAGNGAAAAKDRSFTGVGRVRDGAFRRPGVSTAEDDRLFQAVRAAPNENPDRVVALLRLQFADRVPSAGERTKRLIERPGVHIVAGRGNVKISLRLLRLAIAGPGKGRHG